MARQSRGGGGGSRRPMAAPPRPAPQQTRPATTAAYPPAKTNQAGPPAAAPAQQAGSAGPGLFGQMASTAAGVAVGSSIGHALGGFFGGGSSAPAPEQHQDNGAVQAQGQTQSAANSWGGERDCGVDAKQFTKCLDENQGNMQICGWYLEQLKACQSAASQY